MPILPSIGTELGTGWGALLKRVALDSEPFADVLADQVRFRVTKVGATSIKHVVPDSAHARELWKHPETRRFMQGVLDLANEVGDGPSQLGGISLATSDSGFVANRAVHHFKPGVTPSREAYAAGIDAARNHVDGNVAVRKGAWLHLGARRSEGLLHALEHPGISKEEMSKRVQRSLGTGVKTLLHELDHVGTPSTRQTKHLDWLREGRAETFARWPGRVPHAGEELGLPVPRGIGRLADGHGPYQSEVKAVRALLRMAGINTRKSADFEAARKLIGLTPEGELSKRIASAVAKRHATSPEHARELRATVRKLIDHDIAPDGSHARSTAVRRLARELEQARADRLAAG
jgi:hypothetical protein